MKDVTTILKFLREDYDAALSGRALAIANIEKWRNQVFTKNKEELAKKCLEMVGNITPAVSGPFISNDLPIDIQGVNDYTKEDFINYYLNKEFSSKNFDKQNFIENIVKNCFIEGTSWVRTFWDYKKNSIAQQSVETMEQMLIQDKRQMFIFLLLLKIEKHIS